MKQILQWVLVGLVVALSGCASLGLPPADTFNKKVASAYVTATGALEQVGILLDAKKISADDAANMQTQIRTAKAGIDIARTLYASQPIAAENRLSTAVTTLSAMQAYLASRR